MKRFILVLIMGISVLGINAQQSLYIYQGNMINEYPINNIDSMMILPSSQIQDIYNISWQDSWKQYYIDRYGFVATMAEKMSTVIYMQKQNKTTEGEGCLLDFNPQNSNDYAYYPITWTLNNNNIEIASQDDQNNTIYLYLDKISVKEGRMIAALSYENNGSYTAYNTSMRPSEFNWMPFWSIPNKVSAKVKAFGARRNTIRAKQDFGATRKSGIFNK